MKTLVTGATGFIGANLVRELLKDGYEIKALIRKDSNTHNINGLDIEIVYGDLRDKYSLISALKGCNTLYHVAGHYSLWDSDITDIYDINVEGTENMLDVALNMGLEKVVYTSTVGCIGIPLNGYCGNEGSELILSDLHNHYKRSKYLAEVKALKICRKGLPLVIVNPSTPLGPMDIKPTPTGKIIVDFLNRRMPAYMNTGLNLIDVKDVARGHIMAAQRGRIGERYILGNENISMKGILNLLEEITGINAPRIRIPYFLALIAAHINQFISDKITKRPPFIPLAGVRMAKRFMYFDASKAVKELSLPQSPIKNALEESVKWYRENGYVN